MLPHHRLCLGIVITTALIGCAKPETFDDKLAKGCEAGAVMLIKEGYQIKEIKEKTFRPSAEFGSGFRDVVLTAEESDGWITATKEYKCTFAQESSLLGAVPVASFYQITVDGKTYGKSGNEILGELEMLTQLTQAIEGTLKN